MSSSSSSSFDQKTKALEERATQRIAWETTNSQIWESRVVKAEENLRANHSALESIISRVQREIQLFLSSSSLDLQIATQGHRDELTKFDRRISTEIDAISHDVHQDCSEHEAVSGQLQASLVKHLRSCQSELDVIRRDRPQACEERDGMLSAEVTKVCRDAEDLPPRQAMYENLGGLMQSMCASFGDKIEGERDLREMAQDAFLSLMEETCDRAESVMSRYRKGGGHAESTDIAFCRWDRENTGEFSVTSSQTHNIERPAFPELSTTISGRRGFDSLSRGFESETRECTTTTNEKENRFPLEESLLFGKEEDEWRIGNMKHVDSIQRRELKIDTRIPSINIEPKESYGRTHEATGRNWGDARRVSLHRGAGGKTVEECAARRFLFSSLKRATSTEDPDGNLAD